MPLRKLIAGAVLSLMLANFVMADSSTSYTVDVNSLNGGGNFGSSTNYRLNDTLVGFVNGQMGNSASYTLGTGLVYLELLCGNAILEFGETCDDGNLANGDGCSSVCQTEGAGAVCGNGILQGGEQCDDGNLVNGDGCSAACATEVGGGGGGGGGGYLPVCGNGLRELNEECDDHNVKAGDGCDNLCKKESIFQIAVCGNKIKEVGEGCDDGNKLKGDGCDNTCRLEKPGEEIVPEEGVMEEGAIREIRIIAHPEKRVNAPENWATLSKVVFYSKTLRKTMLTVSVDLNNHGWSAFDTNKLEEGVYDISLKGYSHLTKVLRGVRIDQATQTIDFSESNRSFLVAGDVHESKDDFINGLDISATVNELYSADIGADLNHDGLVNALDLSIVVGNLYKYGEKIKI